VNNFDDSKVIILRQRTKSTKKVLKYRMQALLDENSAQMHREALSVDKSTCANKKDSKKRQIGST